MRIFCGLHTIALIVIENLTVIKSLPKGFVFLVWYYIDRGDQENESAFLCKKRFFVEKIVSIQSDHGAVYLDINSLLIADVKWSIFTLIDAGFQSSVSI